jgi:hypothetical protein
MGIGGNDDDRSAASFVRGLTIGALLGAAVAGSSLWTRRQRAKKGRQVIAIGEPVAGVAPVAAGETALAPEDTAPPGSEAPDA